MKQNYLEKLEYYKIINILSTYCKTDYGKEFAKKLVPSNNKENVKDRLMQTSEACKMYSIYGCLPISNITNISIYLKMLQSSGTLNITGILSLSNILKEAKDLMNYFRQEKIDKENYPSIRKFFEDLYTNESISEKVEKCIIDESTIADNASKQLYSIRKKKQKLEQSIKNILNSFIHSSNNAKYIQEPVVTIRNERYVIPIKQEFRNFVKGFVHDISSSGSTVFIEPISVFDSNNEINNLKIEENIEIEKILRDLSSMFIPYIDKIQLNYKLIGTLDFIFAKAYYSNEIKGITPEINNKKNINLINARHPLIDYNKVVPILVKLGFDYSILLITGPNTGGKTVCLKTIGLLTCMACSGLNIPVEEGSSIFVFDNIFADIGDNQSIENSLSTFSSHMINIIDILNNITENSLVLIDELGSGTDPLEGANLAISILEFVKRKGALAVSTTHYQELKKYALVTEGFKNSSVEFDIKTLQPTYKLLIGVPGKSNAFDISKKLGLNQEIINRASSLLSKQEISFEEVLKRIYDDKSKVEKEKEEIEKNLMQITLLRKQLEKDNFDLLKQENDIINNAKIQAREILVNAKNEANLIISNMKEVSKTSESISELNNMRNRLNESIKSQSITNSAERISKHAIDPTEIKVNLPVYVTSLGQNGYIVSNLSKSNEVQVQIGSIKTSVNIKYLEKLKQPNNKSNLSSSTFTTISKSGTVNTELNIIGLNVDEAVPIVDKFLDDAHLAKLQSVRIVHGKGTGKLRIGIQSFLKNHPHVKSYRIGTFGEGEMGVTIVVLK